MRHFISKSMAVLFTVMTLTCCKSGTQTTDADNTPQTTSAGQPDAAHSDPNVIGWMKGFPPAPDKTVYSADGSYFSFPALRYSVNHMREFYPTRDVPASQDLRYSVETAIDKGLEELTFTPWDTDTTITFSRWLDLNYTDGLIIKIGRAHV